MKELKQVKCPNCSSRIMDEDLDSITNVKLKKKNNGADYYIKCQVCKKELTVKKIK